MDMSITTPINEPREKPPLPWFLGLLHRALFHPARFFREDLPSLNASEALAFGIGNAWIASSIAFFFQTFNAVVLAQVFEKWVQRLLAAEDSFRLIEFSGSSFVWDAGTLVLLPFAFLLRALLGTVTLFLFARLFVEDDPLAPEPVTFRGTMRIQASSYVSHWYGIVPFFGPVLTFIASFVLLIAGVRERFGVSSRRAAVVVLAPYIFVGLAALLFTALLLFAVSQVPFQELLELDWLGLGFPQA